MYAIARYAIARPSVRQSVTRVDQSKTVKVRTTQPSPQSSPMTLVSSWLTSPRNFKGNILNGGAELGVGKIRNFSPISRRISETVQERTKPKLVTRFRFCHGGELLPMFDNNFNQ